MQQQNELLDAIEVIVNKAVNDKTTRVTGGKVKSASGGTAVVTIAGVEYSFPYSGTAPTVGSTCRVFIPNGNMSDAFIGAGGGGGSSGTSNYNSLTNKPKINSVELTGNKSSADLGLYGTDNAPPYPVTSVNGQTGDVIIDSGGGTGAVESVNGKTGAVVLNASDVGALPDTTTIPTVNDAVLTIQKNGASVGTFSANASTNKSINITVPTNNNELINGAGYITNSALTGYAKTDDLPTKISDLTNDSGYITSAGAPVQSVNGQTGDVTIDVSLPDNTVTYTSLGDVEATGLINADTLGGHNVDYFATATALNNKLDKSGGTMTGALILSGAPTDNLQAATKQYVDESIEAAIYSSWEASY